MEGSVGWGGITSIWESKTSKGKEGTQPQTAPGLLVAAEGRVRLEREEKCR